MSTELYKILHLAGIFFVFAALGGAVLASQAGNLSGATKKLVAITHGIALFVVLFGGFGLLKYVGVSHNPGTWPLWVWAKFAIWLFLGAALVLVRKKPQLSSVYWFGLPLLGAVGAWLALTKPF